MKFLEYRVAPGGRYYRAGRLFKEDQTVILPVGEKPPSTFRNNKGERLKFDKGGLPTNGTVYGGKAPATPAIDFEGMARQLVEDCNKHELMERAHGLALDVNGTKQVLALSIVKAEHARHANGGDGQDEPDADEDNVSTTGSAAEE